MPAAAPAGCEGSRGSRWGSLRQFLPQWLGTPFQNAPADGADILQSGFLPAGAYALSEDLTRTALPEKTQAHSCIPRKALPFRERRRGWAPHAEAAERQARGLYSARLPLIPVHVSLDRMEQGTVYYTICYFPFGTVGMSYSEEGLYNIEKPLTGL